VGVLRGKIGMCAIFKENTSNYILLERLINANFGKKYEIPVSSIRKRKSQTTAKMTINRVSNQSAWEK